MLFCLSLSLVCTCALTACSDRSLGRLPATPLLAMLCTWLTTGCMLVQAVPYAQDEIVLLVPHDHELARRGTIDKNELYNLNFVSLHQGNSSRATMERLLQEQDIQCQHLKIDMVRPAVTGCVSA